VHRAISASGCVSEKMDTGHEGGQKKLFTEWNMCAIDEATSEADK